MYTGPFSVYKYLLMTLIVNTEQVLFTKICIKFLMISNFSALCLKIAKIYMRLNFKTGSFTKDGFKWQFSYDSFDNIIISQSY